MDWLEEVSEERRRRDPAGFAASEARAAAAGGGWVVSRPVEGDDGAVSWTVVAEGE